MSVSLSYIRSQFGLSGSVSWSSIFSVTAPPPVINKWGLYRFNFPTINTGTTRSLARRNLMMGATTKRMGYFRNYWHAAPSPGMSFVPAAPPPGNVITVSGGMSFSVTIRSVGEFNVSISASSNLSNFIVNGGIPAGSSIYTQGPEIQSVSYTHTSNIMTWTVSDGISAVSPAHITGTLNIAIVPLPFSGVFTISFGHNDSGDGDSGWNSLTVNVT